MGITGQVLHIYIVTDNARSHLLLLYPDIFQRPPALFDFTCQVRQALPPDFSFSLAIRSTNRANHPFFFFLSGRFFSFA
jgi:hypothetical protein